MKRVLITQNQADVTRILDQVPYIGAWFTNSIRSGTYTVHYSVGPAGRRTEVARVTYNSNKDTYTVYLA